VIAQLVVLLALGLDTLAVAISFGLSGMPASKRIPAALVIAFYSVLMPMAGLLAGESLGDRAAATATYLAGLGLVCAGVYGYLAVRSGSLDEEAFVEFVLDKDLIESPTAGDVAVSHSHRELHLTALLGSMDKLAVGLALGAQDVRPVGALIYLGLQSFALGLLGMVMGKRIGSTLGHKAELVSKGLLVAIGMLIILSQIVNFSLVKD
jgi:manganese efflux pump family protein